MIMSQDKFDIKSLQKRIQEIKTENEHGITFTQEFLKCLFERHNLKEIIHEDQEFEDVPELIVEKIKNGQVPEYHEIALMDIDTQDHLLKDCVWMCGMGAIAWYSQNLEEYKDLEEEEKPFNQIIKMPDMGIGYHSASFLIAAFTMLMADVPSEELIVTLTNNFSDDEKQVEKNFELFNELCLGIYRRYEEDLSMYELEEDEEGIRNEG